MRAVRVTLEFDAETIHPMHRFVAAHDGFGSYRMVHWNFAGDGENLLLFHVVGDPDVYEAALEDVDGISSAEITATGDGAFSVYVHDVPDEFGERLLGAFADRNLIVLPPIEYRADWTIRLTIVGEVAETRRALEALPDALDVEIERVGEYDSRPALGLTDRQREAVAVARELGYYEVPREAPLEDVASELGCAPGTAAEHLRKAEREVMTGLDV